jgi:hypothetical protein
MPQLTARGKRVGRIAAGAVLIAGAALLVHRLVSDTEPRSQWLIPAAWGAAIATYFVAGWIGSRRTLDHADELAVPGLVVPSVGAALLLPLTLHLVVAAAISYPLREFDGWVMASVIFTGPTHLVLALLVGARARQLATAVPAISPARIYAICVGVSCLPFAVIVLPPLVVALTGLPMAALMAWMGPLAARDRLHAMVEAVPRATAVQR